MSQKPSLFLLHGLGLSSRLWTEVCAQLDDLFDCVALDLPGFGTERDSAELTVEELCAWTRMRIRERDADRWLLAGHSMGGKIATLVTAQAERGLKGIVRPLGLILVAASPLSPEPMDETVRQKMLGWVAEGGLSPADADDFIDSNIAGVLPGDIRERLRIDLQGSAPAAWRGWLQRGSREDWSEFAGRLATPTLLLAGREDGSLGETCQRKQATAHFADHRIVVVDDAAHLIPVEQPQILAMQMRDFALVLLRNPSLPAPFARLLASDRVSDRTRKALYARLGTVAPSGEVFSDDQRRNLRVLIDRLLPQTDTAIDLAALIEASLAAGEGDGWRPAELPPDAEAWCAGLDSIAALSPPFAERDAPSQDAWIASVIAGESVPDAPPGRLDRQQMQRWIAEVRRATLRTWLAQPAAMAAIGYDGFANGGDGLRLQGFQAVKANRPEPWQRDNSPADIHDR